MARKAPMAVHVMMDTNCLFTEAADKLIKEELSSFILEWLQTSDVNVTWHLPEIVRAERRHQMLLRAQRLLPHLAKVESLLGHAFGITSETLEERVEAAIKREVDRHKLTVHDVDVAKVHWSDLILRSVQRRPPFDPGEKEKGFRDAIVLETFCQLVETLPKAPQNCRIVLMTGDQILTQVAQERTADRTNVAFTGDLEVLRTMLNALASTLTQEAVANILPKALEKFFKKEEKGSLYYKEGLYERIGAEFSAVLSSRPDPEFTDSTVKRIAIGAPTFLAKSGQRVSFSSRITYTVEATKTVWRPPPAGLLTSGVSSSPSVSGTTVLGVGAPGLTLSGVPGSTGVFAVPSVPGLLGSSANPGLTGAALGGSTIGQHYTPQGLLGPLLTPPPPLIPETIRREGKHIFEVFWSAILGSSGTITRTRVDKIDHKSTIWEEEP